MIKLVEIENRILTLRAELESRFKFGKIKLAENGVAIPTEQLQNELFSLLYKKSRLLNYD